MDRIIVYPGQVPLETDILNTNKNAMVGLASLAASILGPGPYLDGLPCTPGTGLTVSVGAGAIYQTGAVDATAYGSLAADAHQVLKQGLLLDPVVLSCPAPATVGQSINYLVQVGYQDNNTGNVVLPYYNASNPLMPYNGPAGGGAANATVRAAQCVVQVKAGAAATTGSQVTPAADSGFMGAYVVTVAQGAGSISAANISLVSTAPFIPLRLPQCSPLNNFVFNSSIAPSVPNGAVSLLNTAASGIQAVTINASSLTPGRIAMSIANIGGGTAQLMSAAGVYVNVPAATISSGNVTATPWVSLLSNAAPQGVWNNGTTYGQAITLTSNFTSWYGGAAFLVLSATQVLIAYGNTFSNGANQTSQINLVVWNPVSKTAGSVVTLATCYANAKIFLFQTATGFVVFGANGPGAVSGALVGVAGTISGSTISTGAPATVAITNQYIYNAAAMSATTFVLGVGASSNSGTSGTGYVVAATVSGTTVTFGALTSLAGTAGLLPYVGEIIPSSGTNALTLVQSGGSTAGGGSAPASNQLVGFSVSGTTVTPGTPVAAVSGTSNLYATGTLGTVLGVTGVYASPVQAYGITVSGTVPTLGGAQSVSASGTLDSNIAPQFSAPNGIGKGGPNVIGYASAGQFYYVGKGIVPFSVSGTAVTVGAGVLTSDTLTASIAPDGTLGYYDTTSPAARIFSVAANAVSLGATVGVSTVTAGTIASESYSAAHMCGMISLGGSWYPYPPVAGGSGGAANKYILNTAGDAIVVKGGFNSVIQTNFK